MAEVGKFFECSFITKASFVHLAGVAVYQSHVVVGY